MKRLVRNLAFVMITACAPAPGNPAGVPGDKVVFTGDQKSDWAQITALEDQAKKIARTDGCGSVTQCRTAAVGSRACGGPRYYLVYCAATTDSVALFAKLDAVAAAEREYNTRYKIISTCEFRLPPKPTLTAGFCQEQRDQ
jgi:hypothetical protein